MISSKFQVGDEVEIISEHPDNSNLEAYFDKTYTIKEIEYDSWYSQNILHFDGTTVSWFESRMRKVGETIQQEPVNPWWDQPNV